MPMVIPLVAAFAAGAGGVAALGAAATIGGIAGTVATVAAYATIAGAVLTGVGAITGSKDLMKIGAVLSIGGGIAGFAAGAAAGASAGLESAAASASNAEGALPASVTGEAADGAGAIATPVNPGGNVQVTTPTPGNVAPDVQAPAGVGDSNSLTTAYRTDTTTAQPSLGLNGTAGTPSGVGDYGSSTGPGAAGTSTTVTGQLDPQNAALNRVAQGAKDLTSNDVSSWWEKARAAGGAVGKFVQDNPALVKIGGDMLSSMYGPAAEKLDWEQSIYNRARANLNAPIKLTYAKAGS